MSSVDVGDLIFVAGRGAVSGLIQLATFSLPTYGFSHVMTVGAHRNRPILFESTSFARPDCVLQGRPVQGVQCHYPEDIIDDTAKFYLAPLRRRPYTHERIRYKAYLHSRLGRDYDMVGAGLSGGFLLKYVASWICEESNHTMFCSELCAEGYVNAGWWNQRHFSRWSPNSLYRRLYLGGVIGKARRITEPPTTWRIAT